MLNKYLGAVFFIFYCVFSYAQVEIKGLVYDEYLEPFYNANIQIGTERVTSNEDGEFTIKSTKKLPITLTVTAFGHKKEIVVVQSLNSSINIILKENALLDQIVMSATRVPERIIEAPVTIERYGLTDIKKTSSNSFYDGLANLKGVQSREVGYGFKSINTRGFADLKNSRFVQLIDGADTSVPSLNFSAGNLFGASDLDIYSVEILPGASSALYGANAYNGMLLMTTKNPFDFEGISVSLKSGYTSQEAAGNNNFYDVSVRMARKFSESFAAKVNFSYSEAQEWQANDLRNKSADSAEIIEGTLNHELSRLPSTSTVAPYDGINRYGDEYYEDSFNIRNLGLVFDGLPPDSRGSFPNLFVRRSGYLEKDLVDDYRAKNLKFDASFHYRPLKNNSLEFILSSRTGLGTNILQGSSRLKQQNASMLQNKFEIKGTNFYIRGYHVNTNSGDTYDINRTGTQFTRVTNTINNNTNNNWWQDYALSIYNTVPSYDELTPEDLSIARDFADSRSLQPSTPLFNRELNNIKNTLVTQGGSRIYDRSTYTHADGNYNFSHLLNNWANIQLGGSFRQYNPDTKGTIFNDSQQNISIDEFGAYAQIQKKFLEERLRITSSIRYDKSENFEGNYSPRIALNYALGQEKNHLIRASYQTGFRNPTLQEQYLFSQPVRKIDVGTSKDNLDRIAIAQKLEFFNTDTFIFEEYDGVITGDDIINNSLLTQALYPVGGADPKYIKSTYKPVTPEVVQTLELGYRSMFGITKTNNITIDVNAFYSKHRDFIFRQDIITPGLGKVLPFGDRKLTAAEATTFSDGLIVDDVLIFDFLAKRSMFSEFVSDITFNREFLLTTNSKSEVSSYGFGIGLNTKLLRSFDFGVNYNFMDYEMIDKDLGFFEPNFNTPKHTAKIQLGNEEVFKNFGFNINARWQDKYRWVSDFAKGDIDARTVLDAQLNYRVPSMKSKFKIGGTNLFGKEYLVAPGTGQIGQLYYISWIINN